MVPPLDSTTISTTGQGDFGQEQLWSPLISLLEV